MKRPAMLEDDRPHWVYVYYAENDRVLYVGCTSNLKQRDASHARTQDWYGQVVRRTEERFEGRFAGRLAEKVAIQKLRPTHNKVHRDTYTEPDALAHQDALSRHPEKAVELFQAIREKRDQRRQDKYDEVYEQFIRIGVTSRSAARRAFAASRALPS